MMFLFIVYTGCVSSIEDRTTDSNHSSIRCPNGFSLIQSVDVVGNSSNTSDKMAENVDVCVMQYEAVVIDNQAYSKKEAIPSFNMSFYDAQDFCSSTTISFQEQNYHLHLIHFQHWRDAGDGTPGKEGILFPNHLSASETTTFCALPSETTPVDLLSPYPTGTHLECVSESEIYDQIGNLWEWVDSGLSISIDDWIAFHQKGIWDMEITEDDHLKMYEGDLNQLNLHSTCMEFDSFQLNDKQELFIQLQSPYPENCPDIGEGYIIPDRGDKSRKVTQKEILPVIFEVSEDRLQAQLKVHQQRDGEPIGIKVGGAYYSGGDVTLQDLYYGHVPEFNGTIGFRCAFYP